MSEYEKFYEESLYPLQDGVLRKLESIHTPFYLTGGTALGRELIGHRYSDDLDLFLNDHPDYRTLVQDSVTALVEDGSIFTLIDTFENMLLNKISALYRHEPKDIADIWAIAKTYTFSWNEIMTAAKEKEVGVDAAAAAEIILGFPVELFDEIKWKTRPNEETFIADLQAIARDMLEAGPNGLWGKYHGSNDEIE